jgi:hypothetical protein
MCIIMGFSIAITGPHLKIVVRFLYMVLSRLAKNIEDALKKICLDFYTWF